MMTEKRVMRGAVALLAAGVLVIGYNQTRARADGIPAMQPLTYSGTLEEAGMPVRDGTRNLRLTVWDDATSTESSHNRCITTAANTPVNSGRFQVTLDNACTAVVRSTPNLWLEVEVNGSPLGRTKISATPFAVEAGRAAELTPTAANQLVPPGTVVAFAGETAPPGWLLCDGAAVSQSMYPALFAAIGTAHGSGGAGGMFNLPDLRGRFVRGVDRGAGRDPDRAARSAANGGGNAEDRVGSVQGSQFSSHAHSVNDPGHTHTFSNRPLTHGGSLPGYAAGSVWNSDGFDLRSGVPSNRTGITLGTSGGSETRPVNVGLNYIIRY